MYGKDTLGIDEVVATLLSDKSMCKKESGNYSKEKAMVSSDDGHIRDRTTERRDGFKLRGQSQSRRYSQSRDYKKKCYYCDEESLILPKAQGKEGERERKFIRNSSNYGKFLR